jgi:hypothetical protein
MDPTELCMWLRANSSGIYRPAAEAADEIERLRGIVPEVLEKLNDELCAENQRMHETLRSLYTALRDRHYGRMPDEVQTAYDKAGELLRR